jgi:hypothetical protein
MRKNMYARSIERLEAQLAGVKADAEKAAKVWARVADMSREELYMLEDLLRDELHDTEPE